MSDPNQTRQELFDVDGDDDAQYSDTTSTGHNIKKAPSTNTTTSPVVRASAPFTLPDGRMIDCKNTLQSFDTAVVVQQPQHLTNATTSSSSTAKTVPFPAAAFTGPATPWVNNRIGSSQIIDRSGDSQNDDLDKEIDTNTNFNHIVTTEIATSRNDNASGNRNNTNMNNDDRVAVHAEAVAVRSLAVIDAEILDSQINNNHHHHQCHSKRSTTFWLVLVCSVVLIACVTTGVGVYCATGNCGRNVTPVEQIAVACTFLAYDNLSECQRVTKFNGSTVGNTIPSELGWLTQLTFLDLSNRQLTGSIPSTLGNLIQISHLYLYRNQMTGTVPSTHRRSEN